MVGGAKALSSYIRSSFLKFPQKKQITGLPSGYFFVFAYENFMLILMLSNYMCQNISSIFDIYNYITFCVFYSTIFYIKIVEVYIKL